MSQLRVLAAGPMSGARDLLRAAGWRPGRRVDISEELDVLISGGFTIAAPVPAFLAEYARLTIAPSAPLPLSIGGRDLAQCTDSGWCDGYARSIGMPVTPVGGSEYDSTLMDEAGRFWGAFDGLHGLRGRSFEDAVQYMFLSNRVHLFEYDLFF